MTADDLIAAQRLVRRLPVGESVVDAILKLVRSARPGPDAGDLGKLIAWGPSPRASQALMLVARARALLDGRLAPSIDDVIALAEPVLKHRMALTFAARADGETIGGVIGKLAARHRITIEWRLTDQGAATRLKATRRASGRRPRARCGHAAAHPGIAPHRRDRHPRPAWPQARRLRREFLAVPPLRVRRGSAPHRLAPLRARRRSLCARAGMGGRAHGLDLAGPFALDEILVAHSRCESKLDRTLVIALRAGRSAGRCRRAGRRSRPDAADRQPRRDRPHGRRDHRTIPTSAPACRRALRRPRSPRSW